MPLVGSSAGRSSTVSKLTYTPRNDKDYGTLMCSASNEVGTQREPCVYHIILAGTLVPLAAADF